MEGVSFKFEEHQKVDNIDYQIQEIVLTPTINEESNTPIIDNMILSDKRAFNFEIQEDIPGLIIKPLKLACHKMVYFLSKSKDVKISLREVFHDLVEVSLASTDHDINIELLKNSVEENKEINLNEKLAHLKYRFQDQKSTYLYMICPFLKTTGETEDGIKKYEFEFQFEVKNNDDYKEVEATDYMKKYLNYQMQKSNSFSNVVNPIDETTLYEKVKKEIIEAKNREDLENIIKNLQTKYVNVFDTQLNITPIFNSNPPIVRQVGLLFLS